MRIFITTMDDPLFLNDLIAKIIEKKKDEIIGVAESKNSRMTTKKSRRDIGYALNLRYIVGNWNFLKISIKMIMHKTLKTLGIETNVALKTAKKYGIPVFKVNTVNDPEFIKKLKELQPDIIINQAQDILKKEFLSIPKIAVINRHNSLLPHNRGRLSPFWVLYGGEKETGVTIHTVTEKIDQGDIIVQKKCTVKPDDDFLSLTKRCYELALPAILEALDKLENGNWEPIKPSYLPSYNSIPTKEDMKKYKIKLKQYRNLKMKGGDNK